MCDNTGTLSRQGDTTPIPQSVKPLRINLAKPEAISSEQGLVDIGILIGR
ncbi:MAG: hypothetical protein ACLQPD_18685 [Desulfomonilaceae bacterium]